MAESLTPVYTISGSTNPASWGAIPTYSDATWDAVSANWSANGYRLPTEMEWMWAAMGATSDRSNGYTGTGINTTGYTKGYAGSTETAEAQLYLGEYAWYLDNSSYTTHPVGTAGISGHPNELGLYDMSGNVSEWCWDWISTSGSGWPSYPITGTVTSDSEAGKGATSGAGRIYRGGSSFGTATSTTVAYRGDSNPRLNGVDLGFRVVRP